MGLKIQSERFTIPATTGTTDFTITGFGTVSGALLFANLAHSGDARVDHACMSVGMTDGTREVCTYIASEDGRALPNTIARRAHSATDLILLPVEGNPAAFDVEAKMDATTPFITDGIRVDVTNADATNTYYVTVVLFGGTDIQSVYVNYLNNLGTGTGAVAVTDPPDVSDLVFVSHIGSGGVPAEPPNIVSTTNYSFGAWSRDDATQKSVGFYSRNGVAASVAESWVDTNDGTISPGNGVLLYDLSFATNAGGFEVTPSASADNDMLMYMAIAWATTPSIELVDVTLPASAVDYEESQFSFEPEFGMIWMTNGTAADAIYTGVDTGLAVSVIETGQIITTGFAEDDAEATTTDSCSYSDTNFLMLKSDGATVLHSGALQSIDADGWTIDLGGGTHDSRARKGFALAIRAAGTAGAPGLQQLGTYGMNTMSGGFR